MATVSVSFEPSASASSLPRVVHLHLASSSLAPGSVSLFEGTLSSYYLGKLKRGELPAALAERRVPVVSFVKAGELVVAPLAPLAPGQLSLVGPDGVLAELQVAANDPRPLLNRIWPPSAGGLTFAVYCFDAPSLPAMPSAGELVLEPRALSVAFRAGVDDEGAFSERCLQLGSDAPIDLDEVLVPPPQLGDYALSPAVFSGSRQASAAAVECDSGELRLGPGCAHAADDRVTLRTPEAAVLWIVHTTRGALLEVTRAGDSLTIPGLTPSTSERIWGTAHDAGGASPFDLLVTTAAAVPRPILNEALADALGPEPQSEWVELFNDGTLGVDLAQYRFQDGGGRIPLPSVWLGPKSFALLVRDDFEPTGSDEPPIAGALLVRVPSLGKSGLANSGERLALIDPTGQECSVLPALSGKSGQSLARRSPSARDDDPDGFAFGVPTPGFANATK